MLDGGNGLKLSAPYPQKTPLPRDGSPRVQKLQIIPAWQSPASRRGSHLSPERLALVGLAGADDLRDRVHSCRRVERENLHGLLPPYEVEIRDGMPITSVVVIDTTAAGE
jgi:hypothetical protein